MKPFDTVLVLQGGNTPDTDFVVKILSVDSLLFLFNVKLYIVTSRTCAVDVALHGHVRGLTTFSSIAAERFRTEQKTGNRLLQTITDFLTANILTAVTLEH